MIISLVGSHGTGKTAVFEQIRLKHPEYQYFKEGVRHQVPSFGYGDPYKIVDEYGIGIFEVMNINSWSVIDPNVNTRLDTNGTIVTDRSSVDNYAYFLTLKKQGDIKLQRIIKQMAEYYASLVDRFVYFPTGAVRLQKDHMRPGGDNYQKSVDENIRKAFEDLGVPKPKIHHLQSYSVEERVEEVLGLVE